MLKRAFQIMAGLCGAWAGYTNEAMFSFLPQSFQHAMVSMNELSVHLIFAAVGACLFLLIFSIFANMISDRVLSGISSLSRQPMDQLAAGSVGLIAGLLISLLLYPATTWLGEMSDWVRLASACLFGYAGLRIGLEKKEELGSFWKSGKWNAVQTEEKWAHEHKILDTSVIIDGRIADICKTGFIEGTIVIPQFVLEELQHIADSSDLLKRNRGRRGLDILNKIQKELDVQVLIYEGDFEEISEVDSKLVKLAKLLQGKVVTNDFNLNKVCELQGVSVLNINDLANAVKPVVLPGEEIMVQVIKDGKEYGQGVAYLDDGTMIVVEGGRDYIGSITEVLVTSVLQTSAGRMIFAKPKLLEKAQ
ncbi:PIN/TRAM domain-containing protein [Paenibacillus physcomitrellae]|uniref:PIN and TRAM-domain containing protein YacL n=1 Tax=Paenibacillus physcomitrellae TaxID=1619311 RepID=A0ABQ1GVU8_9BACL|nr:PIN/TRAM domain-containing protein [Paenibacillus physcomitrellae]GGA51389.1 putative PIN and TRAM-domain containing protein YacL [Paenibacillus physcomitrellae]